MKGFLKLANVARLIGICRLSLPLLLVPQAVQGYLPTGWKHNIKQPIDFTISLKDSAHQDVEIEYTSIYPKDIPKLAKMISANFDGPYSWWQKMSEIYSVWTLECQLSERFEKFMVRKQRHHLMLVARSKGEAVGFVEVGLVPLAQELREVEESSLDTKWGQVVDIDEETMFPYVGNVVVDESFRRKGIALSLMNQALETTRAWGDDYAFCAVHTENEAATDLYLNKLGFRIFRLEKCDKNFFNPDKRSRYILVKEFGKEKKNNDVLEDEEKRMILEPTTAA